MGGCFKRTQMMQTTRTLLKVSGVGVCIGVNLLQPKPLSPGVTAMLRIRVRFLGIVSGPWEE